MAAGVSLPDVAILVSGTDPNDPAVVDVWTNLAIRTWRVNQASRGRQYELDQNITGTMSLDWRNVDEALNPANASSPFAALVKPMRRIRWMASYPPAGTGNTLNTTAGQDPTFDSYATGTLPAWLTAVGATAPTVQAANPHSGANSVQYTVAATATQQGVATTPLPFIPGKQYTASAYVRQSTASTQQIGVGGLTTMDTFQRTVSSGWGSADTGEAWTGFGAGGTVNASDFNVAAGMGTLSVPVNNAYRAMYMAGFSAADVDLAVTGSVPVMPTGDTLEVVNLLARGTSISSYYLFRVQVETTGAVTGIIFNPAGTVLASATVAGLTYTAGMQIRVRARAVGNSLQLKAWAVGVPEPSAWTISITDTAYLGAGFVGVRGGVPGANTNTLPVVFSYDAFRVLYVAAGTTTTTTAAYVRLQVTFTATQPVHTLQVATVGAAVAGTVNVDDVQAEPGAVANAFVTTGPLIRGVWAGHVGAYPATWVPGSAGFEGSVSAPCVGPFAALAQIGIHTDYVTAVLAKAPAAYWPLWDGGSATQFAEISGNGQPPLVPTESKYGPGNGIQPAQPAAIPGDPGATGVLFHEDLTSPLNSTTTKATTLTVGRNSLAKFPPAPPQTWGGSIAWWQQTTVVPTTQPHDFQLPFVWSGHGENQLYLIQYPYASGGAGPGALELKLQGPLGQAILDVAAPASPVLDGKWHHIVVTVTQDATNTSLFINVDGVNVGATTVATPPVGLINQPLTFFEVGGYLDPFGSGTFSIYPYGGTITHMAMWDRALTSTEAADLFNAGNGYVGETSGTRAARYLSNYYVGPTVVDTGSSSKMGPPSAPEATPLLQALQRIQDTEAGNLFENRDGAVQFDGREIRFLRTTSTATFGDGPGEIPYTEDPAPPVFGYDVTQTNNQALITRTGGIRAVSQPDSTGSIKSFYPRGYTLQGDWSTDGEAIDRANWTVANRAQPKQRVQTVTVDVGANPALFPTILNLEIGKRYTVKRRPKAANNGAGMTMSNDYYLEKVTHRQVDAATASWLVDLELSPTPLQPGIFDDATYGRFDQTLIFGF